MGNIFKTFNHELNQGDTKKQWYMCTFFSAVMNLYYNTGIKLTEEDIEKIAQEQAKNGLFDYEKGGKGQDAFNAVLRYLKNKGIKNIPTLVTIYDDAKVIQEIRDGYMVTTGISVSLKWKKEIEDGVINVKDYKLLAGKDFKHYLNIIDGGEEKFDYLVDNYFFNSKNRPNLYECDINEVLQDIDQNVKYLFKP